MRAGSGAGRRASSPPAGRCPSRDRCSASSRPRRRRRSSRDSGCDRHPRASRRARRRPGLGRRARSGGGGDANPHRGDGRSRRARRALRRRVRDRRHPSARRGRRRRRGRPSPTRAPEGGCGRRDRARLVPRLRAARCAAARLRGPARARRRARQAGRDPHPRRRRRHARRARRVRRNGRPPLLLVAAAAADRARARVVRLVRGQRELPERERAPARGDAGARRPHPRGDRRAVSRAAAGARTPQRARVRGAHGRGARPGARRGPGRARRADRRQRERMLPAVKKEYGQHFLADRNILAVIGRLAELSAGDTVLEIGPGEGMLTRYLSARVAHVHAVEIDRALEPFLRDLADNVDVTFGDALDLQLPQDATKLVANLPYNVATPLIVESLDGLPNVRLWCVMVQREVAERFFARPGTKEYGAVSVLVQLATERTGFHPVSRTVFRPPPNVDSALVAFRRAELPESFARIKQVVSAAFSHRRKTLPNSLELAGLVTRERAATALEAIGRPQNTRAEAIAPREFVALAEALG